MSEGGLESPSGYRARGKDPGVGLSAGAGSLGNSTDWVFQALALGHPREVHIPGPRPTQLTQKLCRWGLAVCVLASSAGDSIHAEVRRPLLTGLR